MNNPLQQDLKHQLVLIDGTRWVIVASNQNAEAIVSRLSDAMQLCGATMTGTGEPSHHGIVRRLFVLIDAHNPDAFPAKLYVLLPGEDESCVVCSLRSFTHSDGLYIQLVGLSSIIAQEIQTRGGILLHGALAEKDGIGVILAAPGGTGKSTASARLPAPWHSRCDDATLVVRDSQGNYWAHPWPTWSRFQGEGVGGSWDVQKAVPLKGIFFLSQALDDRVESVGPGHAVSMLVECAGQTPQIMTRGVSKEEASVLHLERFNNLCALARVIPTHVLHLSLTGTFWQQIDQMLERSSATRDLRRKREQPVSHQIA
ncbi:SynChlorMet cassette protein ScmC [Gammaproteobacteria bacterium]